MDKNLWDYFERNRDRHGYVDVSALTEREQGVFEIPYGYGDGEIKGAKVHVKCVDDHEMIGLEILLAHVFRKLGISAPQYLAWRSPQTEGLLSQDISQEVGQKCTSFIMLQHTGIAQTEKTLKGLKFLIQDKATDTFSSQAVDDLFYLSFVNHAVNNADSHEGNTFGTIKDGKVDRVQAIDFGDTAKNITNMGSGRRGLKFYLGMKAGTTETYDKFISGMKNMQDWHGHMDPMQAMARLSKIDIYAEAKEVEMMTGYKLNPKKVEGLYRLIQEYLREVSNAMCR